MNEQDFSTEIEDLLAIYHWRWTHFRPARTERGWRTALSGDKGFVDYVAVRDGRCLFIELKGDKSRLTPEQEEWARVLQACPGIEYYCWKPGDYERVVEVLKENGK